MMVSEGPSSSEKQEPTTALATTAQLNADRPSMSTPQQWSAELKLAIAAGTKAQHMIAQANALEVSHKGRSDLVTQIDLKSEALIRAHLTAALPNIPILGEEEGGDKNPTQWIVDPLDGTTNFVHGFPAYAVSIALMVDSEVRVGCIVDAVNGDIYAASQGGGATLNQNPIQVSQTNHLDSALLLTGFPYDRHLQAAFYLKFVKAFMIRAQGIRRAGSAALDLAHIASGRADGYWEFGLSPWDIAAGTLLVSEAGGRVSDMKGNPLDIYAPRLLVSNAQIHQDMIHVIHEVNLPSNE